LQGSKSVQIDRRGTLRRQVRVQELCMADLVVGLSLMYCDMSQSRTASAATYRNSSRPSRPAHCTAATDRSRANAAAARNRKIAASPDVGAPSPSSSSLALTAPRAGDASASEMLAAPEMSAPRFRNWRRFVESGFRFDIFIRVRSFGVWSALTR